MVDKSGNRSLILNIILKKCILLKKKSQQFVLGDDSFLFLIKSSVSALITVRGKTVTLKVLGGFRGKFLNYFYVYIFIIREHYKKISKFVSCFFLVVMKWTTGRYK